MNKLVGYCFLALVIVSCQDDDIDGYNLDTQFVFEVYNAEGVNLLDPANATSFQASQIDIYYEVDGEKQRVFNGNYTHPENFSIREDEITDKHTMVLGPNDGTDEGTTVTYVQWNENDADTITCDIARGKRFAVTTQITYNGQEVWSVDGEDYSERRYFTIIK